MNLTFAQVEAEVRRLVAEDPEHIYQGDPRPDGCQKCFYVAPEDGSAEACLFGQALSNLGVSADVLGDHEFGPVCDILSSLGVKYTRHQNDWMSAAQGQQDVKQAWRRAVDFADEEYPLHEAASV